MASADFTKVLVKDDRIANLTDSVSYAVVKGGQNITSASYTAQSATNSSHTYSVQVPSEQVIISREVMWSSTVTFKITGVPANAEFLVNLGTTEAFAPFPLNQMIETMSSTINNNTVSMNVKDVIAPLLHFHDTRELARFNGLTPTMRDTYLKYADASAARNNPLGNYTSTTDNDYLPRGSFKVESVSAQVAGDGGAVRTTYVTVKITEPLMSSPWLYANPQENNQGMYGIQNLSFQFNLDANCRRVWRTSRTIPQLAVAVEAVNGGSGWADSKLIFTYISPHPSDLLPSRNVCPYYNLERFIYNQYDTLNFGTRVSLQSPTLQLNSIPDRIFVVARKRMTTQTYTDTDSFLAIEGISINFNNSSGIGSSYTQQDLFKMSIRNGSTQTWQEFSGYANGTMTGAGALNTIPLIGSVLCLQFGQDIQLSEDYLSQGSLGSYQLSLKVDVRNQNIEAGAGNINNFIPELMIITQTSGVMVNEKGTCSTFLGLLTKSDVLEASTQEPVSKSAVRRLVGGGFFDSIGSAFGKVAKGISNVASTGVSGLQKGIGAITKVPIVGDLVKVGIPLAKQALANSGPKGAMAAQGLSALGMGKLHNRIQY